MEQERISTVIYRTATGRTVYRRLSSEDAGASMEQMTARDSGRRVLRGDPIGLAEVRDMTPEQYDALADANPTWIELVSSP